MSSRNVIANSGPNPKSPPYTTTIYSHSPRVLLGTEDHKARVLSALLPENPHPSSSNPDYKPWIPRVNGTPIPLGEKKKEPTLMTGAHGTSQPAKAGIGAGIGEQHSTNGHASLRELKLTQDSSYRNDENVSRYSFMEAAFDDNPGKAPKVVSAPKTTPVKPNWGFPTIPSLVYVGPPVPVTTYMATSADYPPLVPQVTPKPEGTNIRKLYSRCQILEPPAQAITRRPKGLTPILNSKKFAIQAVAFDKKSKGKITQVNPMVNPIKISGSTLVDTGDHITSSGLGNTNHNLVNYQGGQQKPVAARVQRFGRGHGGQCVCTTGQTCPLQEGSGTGNINRHNEERYFDVSDLKIPGKKQEGVQVRRNEIINHHVPPFEYDFELPVKEEPGKEEIKVRRNDQINHHVPPFEYDFELPVKVESGKEKHGKKEIEVQRNEKINHHVPPFEYDFELPVKGEPGKVKHGEGKGNSPEYPKVPRWKDDDNGAIDSNSLTSQTSEDGESSDSMDKESLISTDEESLDSNEQNNGTDWFGVPGQEAEDPIFQIRYSQISGGSKLPWNINPKPEPPSTTYAEHMSNTMAKLNGATGDHSLNRVALSCKCPKLSLTSKVKHYEGCILCTPKPSPRSSLDEKELFAPSKQYPGPPPLTPPPSPKMIEEPLENRNHRSSRKTVLIPVGSNQIQDMLIQLPKSSNKPDLSHGSIGGLSTTTYPVIYPNTHSATSSHESIGDLYTTTHPATYHPDMGPYRNSVEFDTYKNNFAWPLGTNEAPVDVNLQPEYLVRTESEYHPNLSPSGSIEPLTGQKTTDGGWVYPREYNKASRTRNLGDEDEDIPPTRRASIFNRRIQPPDIERDVKRLPLSNCPIFPGKRGVIRLPDEESPHPGVRKGHQTIGVVGIFETADLEMVELDEPGTAIVIGGEGRRPRWERMKEAVKNTVRTLSSVSLFKEAIRKFWSWCVAKQFAIFFWIVMSVMILTTVTFALIIPTVYRLRINQAHVELTSFEMMEVHHNLADITLGVRVTSRVKNRILLHDTALSLMSNVGENARYVNGLNNTPDTSKELLAPLGFVFIPGSTEISNGDGNITLFGNRDGLGFQIDTPEKVYQMAGLLWGLVWGRYNEHRGISMVLQGKVNVDSERYHVDNKIKKHLIIAASGGFEDMKVDSYRIAGDLITMTLSWFNPSPISLNLGDAEFDLIVGGWGVGQANILGLKITPGYNSAELSSTLPGSNSQLLGEILSSQASGAAAPRELRLMGTGTKVNGIQIPYLVPVIQGFDKELVVRQG